MTTEPEDQRAERTPAEIRIELSKELIEIGKRLLLHAGSLVKSGVRIMEGDMVGPSLKTSAHAGIKIELEALEVADNLRQLEKRELRDKRMAGYEAKREAKREAIKARASRLAGETADQGNVIRGAFPVTS